MNTCADLSASRLFIRELTYAGEGTRKPNTKPLDVFGRHADAFVFVRGGRCQYVFSTGESFVARAGDVIYLPVGSAYRMTHFNDAYSYIFFDFRFGTDSPCPPARLTPDNSEETERLFTKMKNEFDNGKEDGFFTRAQLFYRIYGNAVANREKRYLSPSSKRTVAEAEEYIETHFRDRDLTVRKLADRCGVSESYFRRMFRNFFGTSPNRKIALVRLSLARRMMGDRPELSLSGIAEECGFCSVQYMTELFRREYGISPGKYRRERKRKTEQ